MDDDEDLDQLLDEVEKRFCRDVSDASSTRRKEASDTGSARKQRTDTKPIEPVCTEDIDAFLDELLEEEEGESQQEKRHQGSKVSKESGVQQNHSARSGARKCCPVFVGGSSVTNGLGTFTSRRSCDQLRCVSCDFKVLMFDDCEWDSSCDYLFLRNNMPERHRLRAKLKKRNGSRSYSCQCSWFSSSSSEPTDLGVRPQLRWVCGKHLD